MTQERTDDAHESPDRGHEYDGDLSELERTLTEHGDPYARVTVVRREPPVSANVGDRGVVTQDGTLRGWIGGASCAQTIAINEATAAIDDGEPRLIGIAPDPDTVDRPGLDAFPMTCHSEGVLELFIEPVNAAPDVLVVGGSAVARSLARLADELAVDVTLADPDGEDGDLPDATTVLDTSEPTDLAAAVGDAPIVVVASMGQYDARGVAAGIAADAAYIGLVASDARSEEVIDRAAGLLDTDPDTVRGAVTNPAGVDIAARTPAEIAASLLAELVDVRGETAQATDAAVTVDADASPSAVDPVCGMTVERDDAAATVKHDGETYYFCCRGCADSFESNPPEYLADEGPVSP